LEFKDAIAKMVSSGYSAYKCDHDKVEHADQLIRHITGKVHAGLRDQKPLDLAAKLKIADLESTLERKNKKLRALQSSNRVMAVLLGKAETKILTLQERERVEAIYARCKTEALGRVPDDL
jgi:hypothetical protein